MNNKKWYILQVVSGYEQKVKEDLENRDFEKSEIEEIIIPMSTKMLKSGVVKRKVMFPGYLYVKAEINDQSWFTIRNTDYVTGIVGSSGQRTKPTPISESVIEKILLRVKEEEAAIENIKGNLNVSQIITQIDYKVGDLVKIKTGDFIDQEAKVKSISIELQKVFVEFEFLGRLTQAELKLDEVEKINI